MRRDDVFGYQNDAANPSMSYEELGWNGDEAEKIREEVQEVLGMAGYGRLHRLFVARIESAQRRLSDPSMSEQQLRFEQGVVRGLISVQHAFLEMGKDDVKEEQDE